MKVDGGRLLDPKDRMSPKHRVQNGERVSKKRAVRGTVNVSKTTYLGYIDGVAFEYELGHTDVQVFPTLRALKASHKGVMKECGYVKVAITALRHHYGKYA